MVDIEFLRGYLREIPDFPEPGVTFTDITPLLADPIAFKAAVDAMTEPFVDTGVEVVVGIEARGFVLSAPIAYALGAGLVPIRKPGKLPHRTDSISYELEYGRGALEIHTDAVATGKRVLVVDDVLATGGTAEAAVALVRRQDGDVVGMSFLAELEALGGRGKLTGLSAVHSVLTCN